MNPIETADRSFIPEIRDAEFADFRKLIYRETGIALSDGKREMLCARLAKRLRHYSFTTHAEYYDYITNHDSNGTELAQMINCVTTNKTDFFRETHHFDFLRDQVFPELLARAKKGGPKRLRIWSAACSTGEEPYTLGMTILEHFGPPPGWDVKILASDIDSDVLARAENGVYASDRVRDIPKNLLSKYFLAGRGQDDGLYKVHPDLLSLISFRRINFMDDPWPIRTTFDIIFCRNVIIYFDRPTQTKLFDRMSKFLSPDGYLILGHSENLYGVTDRFVARGGTIYSFNRDSTDNKDRTVATPKQPNSSAAPAPERVAEKTIIAGEVFACKTPTCVSTLLGSCVAACFYDPKARVGGMNHFMLPDGVGSESDSARFGINAMELLINDIMRQGGDRRRLQAKVFGGAKVIDIKGKNLNVGERNAQFVRSFLATESIPIVSEYLGGTSGLKVRFLTHSGQAFVKALDGNALIDVVRGEEMQSLAITNQAVQPEDNITLF